MLAPLGVIEVLLATGRVDPGGLQVTHGIRADPHVLPGGWDRHRAYALEDLRVIDRVAVVIDIREPPAAPHSAKARARAIRATQATTAYLYLCGGHAPQAGLPGGRSSKQVGILRVWPQLPTRLPSPSRWPRTSWIASSATCGSTHNPAHSAPARPARRVSSTLAGCSSPSCTMRGSPTRSSTTTGTSWRRSIRSAPSPAAPRSASSRTWTRVP